MDSLLGRVNRKIIIKGVRDALERRIERHYHRTSTQLADKLTRDLLEGTNHNDVVVNLRAPVQDRNPLEDIEINGIAAALTLLGYGDTRLVAAIPEAGRNYGIFGEGGNPPLVQWPIEIHVSKAGSDLYNLGTKAAPLASLADAIDRLPTRIDLPVTIYVHADPSIDGISRTVYDQQSRIKKHIEFGTSGSLAIVGVAEPIVIESIDDVTLLPKDLPYSGAVHLMPGARADRSLRGSFLLSTSGDDDGSAVAIGDNFNDAAYTRGYLGGGPSDPRDCDVIQPGVSVVLESLDLSFNAANGSGKARFGIFNIDVEFNFDDNGASYCSKFVSTAPLEAIFDFVSLRWSPDLRDKERQFLFRNLVINDLSDHFDFVPDAANTGNSRVLNWRQNGYDSPGLLLSLFVELEEEDQYWMPVRFDGKGLYLSGFTTSHRAYIHDMITFLCHFAGVETYGGTPVLYYASVMGVGANAGVVAYQSKIDLSSVFFFGRGTDHVYGQNSDIGVDTCVGFAGVGYGIKSYGMIRALLASDPVSMSGSDGDIYWASTVPAAAVAWPAYGVSVTDSLGAIVAWVNVT